MRTIHSYTSYNFIDKDPIIDLVMSAIKESGYSLAKIERESGVSYACLRAWDVGRTKRPQHCTIRAVLRCIGYDLQMVNTKTVNTKIRELYR